MMNIVDKIIKYTINNNNEEFGVIPEVGSDNLIVIVVELLSWLKLERKRELWIEQGRKTKLKPMKLNMNYPWCIDLVKILQVENLFSEVFIIKDNYLMFKDDVDPDYIREARFLAEKKYNPEVIIN